MSVMTSRHMDLLPSELTKDGDSTEAVRALAPAVAAFPVADPARAADSDRGE
ncbi:hypothetical protein [Streptomyces sp. R41]|uniref:FXSXX-COOH protein n=1 Tax=Streptomyces sp. R41 TaxID=3238632 RepID=A0AB39RQV9_9ACTN